jgi:hypothetical protein
MLCRWYTSSVADAAIAGRLRAKVVAAVAGTVGTAIMLCGLSGCYSPPKPRCGFICGADGACPKDYTCSELDNRCHLDGTALDDMCFPPGTLIDAPTPDTPDMLQPTIASTDPLNGVTGVGLDKMITISFSEPVEHVDATTLIVHQGGTPSTGTVATPNPFTATFTPSAPWPASSTITITLSGDIADLAGNALAPPLTFSFMTGT